MSGTLSPDGYCDVAITGIGLVTPLGDDPTGFLASLTAGRCSVRADPELGGAGVSRIEDFDATRYANVRGMRIYNRATRMAISAAKLALGDSGVETLPETFGLVTASSFGQMSTLIDYDRSLLENGISGTNPALMPLALPSALGSAVALAFGAKAFSITLQNGGASSLDAVGLGARLLCGGRGDACLVVASLDPTPSLCRAALSASLLAPTGEVRVFDRTASGTALGEAGVALVLERTASARERGAKIRGILRAQSSAFGAEARQRDAVFRCCTRALASSRTDPSALALVSASANGVPARDRLEADALASLFGESTRAAVVTAPAAHLGDTLDASGLLGVVAALGALGSGRISRIPGLTEPQVPRLRYAMDAVELAGDRALVLAHSTSGACSAVLLQGPEI